MAELCIPPDTVKNLLGAFKRGELKLDVLQDPSIPSEVRHEMFAKYFPKGQEPVVTWMNGKFEEALLSNKKDAITSWLKKTFKPKDKKTYLHVIDQINKLDKLNALDPNSEYGFMQDLVATKLGVRVTSEEVQNIVAKSKVLDSLSEVVDAQTGTYSKAYWKALSEFNDYVDSLSPTRNLRVFTSLIGRGTMLFSAKSPITNIVSNTVQGASEALNRRIASGQWKGLNNDFWKSYVKNAMDIYNESGYDISRLDKNWMGQKRLGEDVVHSQGPGAVRKAGRWVEDVIFDKMMGTPDAATAVLSFSDSANLAITKQVKTEGLSGAEAVARHLQLSKEVAHTDLSNASDIAKSIRAQAIADARVATWTNDSGISWLASSLRKGLNKATGDFRIGDQLMPFVKTPANVVSAGLDAAGVGFIKALAKQIQAVRTGDPRLTSEAIRDATTAGTGLALALAIVYNVNPEDSTGTYESYGTDQKARDIIKSKNAPYNAIKLGGKWISYDYFGPLGPAISGFMAARKAKEDENPLWEYGKSVKSQVIRVPGMQEVSDLAGGWSGKSAESPQSFAESVLNTVGSFAKSRTIPGIAGDIASMTDPYQREIGTSAVNQTMAAIPGVRQMLPEKINQMTGEPLANENPLSTLLFGRRVTTPVEDDVINEIDRLNKSGNGPATSDIARVGTVKTMKSQLDDAEYQEAMQYYGSQYSNRVTELIRSQEYEQMTDAKKADEVNKIREDVMEDMVLKYTKNLTPQQKTRILRKEATALLSISYDTIPDQVWGPIEQQYPGLRAEATKQAKLADSGTASEKAYAKRWFEAYPMALKARQRIAQEKINMRKKYPEVGAAYDLIYK